MKKPSIPDPQSVYIVMEHVHLIPWDFSKACPMMLVERLSNAGDVLESFETPFPLDASIPFAFAAAQFEACGRWMKHVPFRLRVTYPNQTVRPNDEG